MRAAMIAVLGLVSVASAAPKTVDPVKAANDAMAEADFDKALSLLNGAEATAITGERVAREFEIVPGLPMTLTLELPVNTAPPAQATVASPPRPLTTATRAPPSTTRPKLALIPLGLGFAAIGLGVGLAVDSVGQYTALKQSLDQRAPPPDFTTRVAAGRMEQTIGIVVGRVAPSGSCSARRRRRQ